jgi:hypothetical protein
MQACKERQICSDGFISIFIPFAGQFGNILRTKSRVAEEKCESARQSRSTTAGRGTFLTMAIG